MKPRVSIIGDLMLDRYLVGSTTRVSPEAPIPVLNVDRVLDRPGGAGNVAVNVASLNAEPLLFSVIGNDEAGYAVMNALAAKDITQNWLIKTERVRTTTKTRLISDRHHVARYDIETKDTTTLDDLENISDVISRILVDASCVVLSDYAKGVCSTNLCEAVIKDARARKIPVIVDPKSADFSKYRNAHIITPNKLEAEIASNRQINSSEDAIRVAKILRSKYKFDLVVITLGEQGLVAASKKTTHFVPGYVKEVFDVTGAGDTVVATLAVCMSLGVPIDSALTYANAAAAAQVSHTGTTGVTWSDIFKLTHTTPQKKNPSLKELQKIVAEAKLAGKKVGFTNGCFDILHAGHVLLLEAAAQECDLLIVAVNSDASIRRLKGANRPYSLAVNRKTVLAAISHVDYVIEFEEDTPLELIKRIQPDVLIKGADYAHTEIIGADFVQAYGGRVVTPAYLPNVSTTEIAKRAKL